MNKVEKPPEQIFKEFDEDIHSRYLHQRGERLKKLIELLETQGRDVEKQQAVWEFALSSLHIRDSASERKTLGERFGPMMVFSDGSQLPDPAIFTDEAIDYYARRAEETSNPILHALYCDFIWEKRSNHRFARKAIDGYLQCVSIYLANGWYHEVADAVSRATELALRLNDNKEIEKARTSLLDTMDKLAGVGGHPALRYCLDIIDALLAMGENALATDLKMALDVCGKGIAFYTSEAAGFMYYIARNFEEKQVELWKRLGNETERSNAEIRIGELYEKEAELKGGSSNMVGAIFLQQAAQHYANIGKPDKVEQLKIEVKKRWKAAVKGGEFKRVETTAEFPAKQIDQYAQKIMKQGIDKALRIISLDLGFVPDIDKSRKIAAEQKYEFPLLGLVPQIKVEEDRQVAVAAEQEEIDEANSLRQYAVNHGLSMLCLGKLFDMLREQGGLTKESFLNYLSTSPFLDEDKLDLISPGIERYFAGDYVSAIHILVPHVEDILRRVIDKLGVSTTTLKRKGVTHEKMPDTILDTPELRELLGEQVWFYFKYVLIHPLGKNLRHDVAHGLINKERCTRDTTETVFHLLLLLTPYQVV